MLAAVRDVANGLLKDIGREVYYPIENVALAVEAYTPVTRIFYVDYDVPRANPVWGQFKKYSYGPKAYSGAETIVEIRYARHLDMPWRRFVVCKELCHSLEYDKGTHSAGTRAIDRLLSRFALMSAHKPVDTSFPAFDAEGLAEIGALELLCPLEIRKKILGSDTPEVLCRDYGIPVEYADFAFSEDFSEIVESIFEDL